MKDVYIVQCLMETDLYKLLKTQVKKKRIFAYSIKNMQIPPHDIPACGSLAFSVLHYPMVERNKV